MKTAMQEFKDWYYHPNGFYLQSEVEDKINELLESEKKNEQEFENSLEWQNAMFECCKVKTFKNIIEGWDAMETMLGEDEYYRKWIEVKYLPDELTNEGHINYVLGATDKGILTGLCHYSNGVWYNATQAMPEDRIIKWMVLPDLSKGFIKTPLPELLQKLIDAQILLSKSKLPPEQYSPIIKLLSEVKINIFKIM